MRAALCGAGYTVRRSRTRRRLRPAQAFVDAVEAALAAGDPSRMSDEEIERVMTAAVRIYAAKADIDGQSPPPVDGGAA